VLNFLLLFHTVSEVDACGTHCKSSNTLVSSNLHMGPCPHWHVILSSGLLRREVVEMQTMTVKELAGLMQKGKDAAQYIDVREEGEYAIAKLPHFDLLPLSRCPIPRAQDLAPTLQYDRFTALCVVAVLSNMFLHWNSCTMVGLWTATYILAVGAVPVLSNMCLHWKPSDNHASAKSYMWGILRQSRLM